MIDSFPFDEWAEDIAGYWTFGPGNSTGTYVLTVLGIAVMVLSIIGWVVMENRKLAAQAALLRAAGGLPAPGGIPPGPGPSQPPLAGPSTDPGM
ncbi:MAG TPA: hypothetical protein VNO56_09020 [Gaiellaceae bacterium]|jgi:hypothetical protein|nr:hypothetical protein [Gaiellaceae bacterium]